MDLRISSAAPTAEERDAIDAVLAEALRDPRRRAGRRLRDLLLPALQAAQARAGFISAGALNHLCERLGIPPAEAHGVASFYGLLATEQRPRRVLRVCDDIGCRCRGALEVIASLEASAGPPGGGRARPRATRPGCAAPASASATRGPRRS